MPPPAQIGLKEDILLLLLLLLKLNEWCKANKLTLNVDKKFYMAFHRAKIKTDNHKLSFGQATLRETNQYEYLGIII